MEKIELNIALRKQTQDIINLIMQKNTDYNNAYKEQSPVGILLRMQQKLDRLLNIEKQSVSYTKKHEAALHDTVRDLLAYGLLFLCEKEKEACEDDDLCLNCGA